MSEETANLGLPYILANQAQKHTTHNEALRGLDAVVQLCVIDRHLTSPPALPIEGDRYIVATTSTGEWDGKDGQIAAFQNNAWAFYSPIEGWLCWVADEDILLVFDGVTWSAVSTGAASGGTANILNSSANGAKTKFELHEEELTLSGASVDSTILIPSRAIVFGVSTRTTQAINGATSYDCGIIGETNKYGSLLSIVANSTNSGVTGPTAYYSDTAIRITANGGNFTGGKVRAAIHYMLCETPTS